MSDDDPRATRPFIARLRALRATSVMLVVAACDASVRLGAIGSEDVAPAPDSSVVTMTDAAADADAGAVPPDASAADTGSIDAGPLLTLATGMAGAEWIAVGGDHVTWTTSGRSGTGSDLNAHYVAEKSGSNRVTIKSEPGILRGVVIDGPTVNAVRWISPVTIVERASVTSAESPHVTGFFLEGYGITADGTSLFTAATTKVTRIDRSSDAGSATQLLASFTKAVALTSDGDQLYVVDQGGQRVARVEKATGNVTWSHAVGSDVNDIATNGDQVYFAGGGKAGHVLKTAGGLTIFDLPGANALAIDDSGIYYATTTAILRAELATPDVTTTLASGFVSLGRIALDTDFIYFTDSGAGAIYRLKK